MQRTPVKDTRNALETTKVGSNKNVIDNETDGSGDESEGGAMLMAVEGIVDERTTGADNMIRVEVGAGAAQAPTQALQPSK